MSKEQIAKLLVELEIRNKVNYQLWQMGVEEGNKEVEMRYFGQHAGMDEAIREIRKAAGIEYLEHIENCVMQGVGPTGA